MVSVEYDVSEFPVWVQKLLLSDLRTAFENRAKVFRKILNTKEV